MRYYNENGQPVVIKGGYASLRNEYGAAGTSSTTLVFLQRIPADMDILVRVN